MPHCICAGFHVRTYGYRQAGWMDPHSSHSPFTTPRADFSSHEFSSIPDSWQIIIKHSGPPCIWYIRNLKQIVFLEPGPICKISCGVYADSPEFKNRKTKSLWIPGTWVRETTEPVLPSWPGRKLQEDSPNSSLLSTSSPVFLFPCM